MKLREFRVRAFRCIHNTGSVTVSDTAALIGKNESGKTAILAALAHLNRDKPIDPQDICDDLVDDLKPDDRIVEALFELTPAERDLATQEVPGVSDLTHVRIFRTKAATDVEYEFPSAKFSKKFAPNPQGKPLLVTAVETFASRIADATERLIATEEDSKSRKRLADELKRKFDDLFAQLTVDDVDYRRAESVVSKLSALTSEVFKSDKVVVGSLAMVKKGVQAAYFLAERQPATKFFVREKLHPRLIYFPDYKVIDGIIDVEQYAHSQQAPVTRTDIGYQFQKAETIRNLFHLAEVDPAQLQELAANPARLNSELVRSSQRLTRMLALTWKARKVGIRLTYSAGIVTVVVSDIFPDGTTKNEGLLDRRSAGFKWHFSFFVNFRAGIQQNTFKDAILLLDEPGLNLHPEQQAGLVDVIRDLSQTNQVLYTTHSPFMIYNFDRGNLLIVEFDPESKASRIQQNFWDGDWQTIRPVLHSIGDGMLLKVFKGSDVLAGILAVEGITDQRYLVTIAELGVAEDDDSKLGGIEPIPSGGHTLVRERALHYRKRKKRVAALFDNEPDALVQAAQLGKQFPAEAIVRLDTGKPEGDIEDLFTDDDYLKAVNGLYLQRLRDAKNFGGIAKRDIEPAEGASPRIVKRLEIFFRAHSADGWGSFDKQAVCEFFCDRLATGEIKLAIKSKERFDNLFAQIREAVEAADAKTATSRTKTRG